MRPHAKDRLFPSNIDNFVEETSRRLPYFANLEALTLNDFFWHHIPLCLFLNSITPWQLAHVLQPGTAARRGSGIGSSHSSQRSADTALRSMR